MIVTLCCTDLNTRGKAVDNLLAAATQFKPIGKVTDIREFGNGNINNTFLVTMDTTEEKHFILQRVNTRVFQRPECIIRNMRTLSEHIHKRLQDAPLNAGRRWEVPQVLLTQEKQDHWLDSNGAFWRALSFIDGAQSFGTIQDSRHAREAGYALGMFQHLVSDLPAEKLIDTLEEFHITPYYLQRFNKVVAKHSVRKSPEVQYCLQFIGERSSWTHVLEDAKAQGRLCLRPIHGDPKVDNIMMDNATGHAISIIDLDTVKPGLVHYDVGDCLRSGCNPLGEKPEQWETVHFHTDLCQAILQGYFPIACTFLTENDYDYLYDAIRLIAFELGLRYFTDYVEGNVYFKIRDPEHNLTRALVQFKLTESIESQEATIRTIIRDMR